MQPKHHMTKLITTFLSSKFPSRKILWGSEILNHITVTNNSVVSWQTDVGNEEHKNLLSWQSIWIFVLAARLQEI